MSDLAAQGNKSDDDNNMEPEPEEKKMVAVRILPKKRKGKEPLIQQKPGESKEAFHARRNAFYSQRKRQKKKNALSKKNAEMNKAIATAHEAAQGGDDDFFLKKVAGMDAFNATPDKKKYDECKANVTLRLNVTELLDRRIHAELKHPTIVSKKIYYVSFHVDMERDVGDEGTIDTPSQIRKLPETPWLVIKPSSIEKAGHGCFADKNFKKGDIIGMYMGGEDGDPEYTIQTGSGERVHCYSFTTSSSMGERSARTMGMQMMNDPRLDLEEGEEAPFEYNAQIGPDLFVVALEDIKKGEEIFTDYHMSADSSDEDDDGGGDEGGSDDKDDGDGDGGDGDGKPKAKGKPKLKHTKKKTTPKAKENEDPDYEEGDEQESE